MRARVTVRLKPGVLDVQGQAIGRALGNLGFGGVQVRAGKIIELDMPDINDWDRARADASEMARQLLANPVIEDFDVEVFH